LGNGAALVGQRAGTVAIAVEIGHASLYVEYPGFRPGMRQVTRDRQTLVEQSLGASGIAQEVGQPACAIERLHALRGPGRSSGDRSRQPLEPLGEMVASPPEARQRAGEAQAGGGAAFAARAEAPVEGGAQVVVLDFEPGQPGTGGWTPQG